MQKQIVKIFFDFEIIAFELVALNTHFHWQTIHFIGDNVLTNSLKILDTTKKEFFELIFFLNDQKIWQSFCQADLSSVWDPLTCWLSISVLTRDFLAT